MKDINRQIIDAFESRFACKGYDPDKKVSDDDFEILIEVARLSPSSMGLEPWEFVLLKDEDLLEDLKPYAWGAKVSIDGASHIVAILGRVAEDLKIGSEYTDYMIEDVQNFPEDMLEDRKATIKKFQEVDFGLTDDQKMGDWIRMQTYIPLANMLTTAALLGIDATPIEGFDREKVHEVMVKHGVYDPDHFKIATFVSFGYANREHRPKTRRKKSEVFREF